MLLEQAQTLERIVEAAEHDSQQPGFEGVRHASFSRPSREPRNAVVAMKSAHQVGMVIPLKPLDPLFSRGPFFELTT
jgi:hypothetical protein